VAEIENIPDGFISRLDTIENNRTSDLEAVSIETSKVENKREKGLGTEMKENT
jgi:hypothetical protein